MILESSWQYHMRWKPYAISQGQRLSVMGSHEAEGQVKSHGSETSCDKVTGLWVLAIRPYSVKQYHPLPPAPVKKTISRPVLQI